MHTIFYHQLYLQASTPSSKSKSPQHLGETSFGELPNVRLPPGPNLPVGADVSFLVVTHRQYHLKIRVNKLIRLRILVQCSPKLVAFF